MFSKDLGIDLGTMFTRLADGTQVLLDACRRHTVPRYVQEVAGADFKLPLV